MRLSAWLAMCWAGRAQSASLRRSLVWNIFWAYLMRVRRLSMSDSMSLGSSLKPSRRKQKSASSNRSCAKYFQNSGSSRWALGKANLPVLLRQTTKLSRSLPNCGSISGPLMRSAKMAWSLLVETYDPQQKVSMMLRKSPLLWMCSRCMYSQCLVKISSKRAVNLPLATLRLRARWASFPNHSSRVQMGSDSSDSCFWLQRNCTASISRATSIFSFTRFSSPCRGASWSISARRVSMDLYSTLKTYCCLKKASSSLSSFTLYWLTSALQSFRRVFSERSLKPRPTLRNQATYLPTSALMSSEWSSFSTSWAGVQVWQSSTMVLSSFHCCPSNSSKMRSRSLERLSQNLFQGGGGVCYQFSCGSWQEKSRRSWSSVDLAGPASLRKKDFFVKSSCFSYFSELTNGAGFSVSAQSYVSFLRNRSYFLGCGSMSFSRSSCFFRKRTVFCWIQFASASEGGSGFSPVSFAASFRPKNPPLPPRPPSLYPPEFQKHPSVVMLFSLSDRPATRVIIPSDQLQNYNPKTIKNAIWEDVGGGGREGRGVRGRMGLWRDDIFKGRQELQQMIREYDYLFKVVIIGNSSVGKSSLLRRFADDSFQESYLATIGVDFRFKSTTVEGEVVKLQIWDTAGQERFRTITGAYYKGAHAILVVYDITKRESFEDIDNFWIGEIEKYASPNVHLAVLGNKSDLEELRKVEKTEVEGYCRSKNIKHIEVSAKSGDHVGSAFQEISEVLTKLYPKEEKAKEGNPIADDIRKKRKEFQLQAGKQAVAKNQKQCCL